MGTNLQDEIIRYRAKYNISQYEFAKRCKLTVQTINAIENGIQTPSRLTLEKINIVLREENE